MIKLFLFALFITFYHDVASDDVNRSVSFDKTETPDLVLDFTNYTYSYCNDTASDESLRLDSYGISKIERGFAKSINLKAVSLQNNRINYVDDGAFDNLPNLACLNLAGNSLKSDYINTFAGHLNIRTLILSDQTIVLGNLEKVCNRTIPCFPRLTRLNLNGNSLSYISNNFIHIFPKVKHLHLQDNAISSLESFDNLPETVEYLYLSANRINLRNLITKYFKKVYALYLDDSPRVGNSWDRWTPRFDYQSNFGNYGYLKVLSLAGCRIDYLEDNAFKDLQLTHLDLSRNKLENLPVKIFDKMNLKSLTLSRNRLKTFPVYSVLKRLENLSLSYNDIEVLPPESMSVLHSLRKLSLRENRLLRIDENTFALMDKLEYLDIEGNQLTVLPHKWMLPLKSLRYLNVNANKFVNLKDASIPMSVPLKDLYVRNNSFSSINVVDFDGLPKKVVVHVD